MTQASRTFRACPDELVGFHADRAAVYGALASLVAEAPSTGAIERAARDLRVPEAGARQTDRVRRDLSAALGGAAASEAASEFEVLALDAAVLACSRPEAPSRLQALGAASVTPARAAAADLRALALLAASTARSLGVGDVAAAAAASDAQADFLRAHAGACLRSLARGLETSGGPFYRRVGSALRCRIDDDLPLLATRPGGMTP